MRSQIALKDVTLYWANLRQRNEMSGKYQVDLCNLNEKQKEALEDAGILYATKGMIVVTLLPLSLRTSR
jgi:hypothetical protein